MKRIEFLILIVGLLSSRLSSATSFEYIDSQKKTELSQTFASARSPTKAEIQKSWNCDMYGVKTSLQVKRNVALYSFAEGKGAYENTGALPVPDYKLLNNKFIGKSKNLSDEIKIDSAGNLISRLSSGEDGAEVVAYSVCK
jgi:hypothetical protein